MARSDGAELKDTMGRLVGAASESAEGVGPRPGDGLASHDSMDSGCGVPVGVELVLSTRCCLGPERGVMLECWRRVDTGVPMSPLGVSAALPVMESDLVGRRASGVTVWGRGFWGCCCCCGVVVAAAAVADDDDAIVDGGLAPATLGVRGGRVLAGRDKAGIDGCLAAGAVAGGFVVDDEEEAVSRMALWVVDRTGLRDATARLAGGGIFPSFSWRGWGRRREGGRDGGFVDCGCGVGGGEGLAGVVVVVVVLIPPLVRLIEAEVRAA